MSEKYQARDNGLHLKDFPEKTEKEKRQESSAKVAKVAAKGAAEYFAPGMGGKAVDMISNTKTGQKVLNAAGKTLAKNPIAGRMAKKLDDDGLVDTADNVAGMIGGKPTSSSPLKNDNGTASSGMSKSINPIRNDSKNSGNGQSNSSSSMGDSNDDSASKSNKKSILSDFGNDNIGKLLLKKVGKKYVIIACVGFFVFLLLFTVVVGAKDFGNLDLTNNSTSIVSHSGSSSVANLSEGLETVANWYIENVKIYSQSTFFDSPFPLGKVRADCTGFTAAYMSYVAGESIATSSSLVMIYTDGDWAKQVSELGWKAYSSDEVGTLQFGDVLVADDRALYSTKGQHAEVYVDDAHTFGWGAARTSYPLNNIITTSNEGGHVHFKDSYHDYITVYRYEGAFSFNSSLNATMMNDSSFNHGTKDKNNQKYIMLHDTEMSVSAIDVVKSWASNGSGVAAHFVIDKDGTIIQAVDLDVIAHHAGPGGPGDYDAKFGVGNNDGKGLGDDLVGNPTGTGAYANYTSYGMNSYSIGIEMCHVNGESYPEEQLNALDKVIAYIDSYYGFESTIIDHKEWRPSNSDTDTNFLTYLNNYKTLRHH